MPVVQPIPNGPLDVRDVPNLRDEKSGPIDNMNGNYQLCRCGQSKNKPFCDYSHVAAGFQTPAEDVLHHDKVHKYWGEVDGQKVTVGYNPALCSHAKRCWKDGNPVFRPKDRPWIHIDQAPDIAFIRDKVNGCPSGALEYKIGDEEFHREDPEAVEIVVADYGPYIVRNVDLCDAPIAEDEDFAEVTLCSCGMSQNKPYCDGSHLKIPK